MSEGATPRREVFRTRDLIGSTVTDARGAKVGTVGDLLIDRTGQVRYLSVSYGLLKKHVLMPSDALEWGEGGVLVSRWTDEQVKSLPLWDPERALTDEGLKELETAYPRFYGPEALRAGPGAPQGNIIPLAQARSFKLSGGASDLRGWTVFAADAERVGTVTDMLVDPAAMKVRYLAVALAQDLFRFGSERNVLVPTEAVDLRERGQDVVVRDLDARALSRLPAWLGGPVDPLVEERVAEVFAAGPSSRPLGDERTLPPPGDSRALPPRDDSRSLPPPADDRRPYGADTHAARTGDVPPPLPPSHQDRPGEGPPPVIREDLHPPRREGEPPPV